MTPEEKQLLIKDLCGRLLFRPKGVRLSMVFDPKDITIIGYSGRFVETIDEEIEVERVRLYLRPMSSMTEEEKKVVCSMNMISDTELNDRLNYQRMYVQNYTIETFDYFNERKLDYRGLIEKGLALEATEGVYKID